SFEPAKGSQQTTIKKRRAPFCKGDVLKKQTQKQTSKNTQAHKNHIQPMTLFAFDQIFLNIAILFKVKNYPLAIERLQVLRDLGLGEATLERCLENDIGKPSISFFRFLGFLKKQKKIGWEYLESFLTVSGHRGIAKFLSYYREYQQISSTSSGDTTDEIRRKQFLFFEELYGFCHINSKEPMVTDLPIQLRSNILRELVVWVYPDPSSSNFNQSFSIDVSTKIQPLVLHPRPPKCMEKAQIMGKLTQNALKKKKKNKLQIAEVTLLESSLEMLRTLILNSMFQHFTQIVSNYHKKALS
ncbi:MAG: hypothetical protein GY714_27005, partial [Desulfobacterales bacterium]|nr:hypothetical protein [Desulfobacterales bacterium]